MSARPPGGVSVKQAEQKLNVKLQVGDRFPLLKTVTETVTQQTDRGTFVSRTTLKMLLAIRVLEVRNDRKKLRVDYQRVQFSQEMPGETIHYDSAVPSLPIPLDAQAYHGLVNNGFDFWIGADNKVVQIDDFEGFLKRCVKHVPTEQRKEVMLKLMKSSGDEGIANFIDDSIGLLPAKGAAVKVGDTWKRNRQIIRPVPLYLSSTCTLKSIDEHYAEITINGKVIPSTTFGPSRSNAHGLQLTVIGGYFVGHCRIDRKTGLPEKSEIRRVYDMIVRLPNGREIKQTKESKTVIAVYSPQGNPQAIRLTSAKSSAGTDRLATAAAK